MNNQDQAITESKVTTESGLDLAKAKLAAFDAFVQAYKRANVKNAKPADIEALREVLDENKESELWRFVRGAAKIAEAALLTNAGIPSSLRECWKRELEAMRAELGYKDAPLVERMLIDNALCCWLRLNLLEAHAGQTLTTSQTLTLAMFIEKRIGVAQRRFNRALETLTKVRMMTAATALIESRTATAQTARTFNNARLLKAA